MDTKVKSIIWRNVSKVLTKSLEGAAFQQDLGELKTRLARIVPDIREQYTAFKVDDAYLETKVRNMHAFQVSLIKPVLDEFKEPCIVDIGDSAGTHLQYLLGLYANGKKIRCLSVNLEKAAVDKIQQKGLEAVQVRAEHLRQQNIDADIFLCFEMLEHLMNPCQFLHELSMNTKAKYFILTVPYLKKSRVGLHQLRRGQQASFGAETTHLFELCPEDWKLLFRFSGWRVDHEAIYRQYPRHHWLGVTRYYWRKYDFEGFYGVRLTPDRTWSSRYLDW